MRNVCFLDGHRLGRPRCARELFEGVYGVGRLLQGATTVTSLLQPELLGGVDDSSRRLTSVYEIERNALPRERT